MTDERTATLARALWSELDYALGVDPNTLARFCIGVIDTFDQRPMNTRERLEAWIETFRIFGSDKTSGELADEVVALVYGEGD